VLIGTSEYADKNLPDVPPIETTIDELAAALTDLDYGQAPWDSQHCVTLVNEGDLREVGRRLGTAAEEATDLLLVYYAGRGLLDKRNRSLHLGLVDSDPRRPGFNSLEYAKLRDTVLDSHAAMKVIVLDCHLPDGAIDQLDVKDAYVLASSFQDKISGIRPGDIHTTFSRHLITLIREGVQGGPGLLRIEDIYYYLLDRMQRDGLPQPQNRGTSNVDGPLAVIRNRANLPMPRPVTDRRRTVGLVIAPQKPRAPEKTEPKPEPRTAPPPLPMRLPALSAKPEPTSAPKPAPKSAPVPVPAPAPKPAASVVPASSESAPRHQWFDEWMLDWVADNADRLAEHVPGVAAELLTKAIDSIDPGTERYAWFASRLAQVLFRIGDLEQAQDLANIAIEYTSDPDLLVHIHSTLAQCQGIAGSAEDALSALGKALGSPGLTLRHRARLLVPAARTHLHLGEFTRATEVASDALKAAGDADDTWAKGWALHVLATTHHLQGDLAGALPAYDRALEVAQSDPALTDLKLLSQLNKAATLGNLSRYDEALSMAMQARSLADQVGTVIRLAQARSLLGELFYETGQWDDALTEATSVDESLKEPATACVDLATAAAINFHRGSPEAARRFLTAAETQSGRLGQRFIAPLALARSLDWELTGDRAQALAALTAGLDGGTEEVGEIDFMLPDAVRLALLADDDATAERLTVQAVELADGSQVPHRQANELYCRGLTSSDAEKLLAAAARYEDAQRPLYKAKALEAAATVFTEDSDEDGQDRGREARIRSVETYEFVGASADAARVRGTNTGAGIPRQLSDAAKSPS